MGFFGKLRRPKVIPLSIRDLASFESDVLGSEVPVIVDVWSENCAPCRQLAPVLTNVASKYDGRVRVAEINTDAEPGLLRKLGVRATPTIIIYHDGEEFGRSTGFRPESWFSEMIEAEFPES